MKTPTSSPMNNHETSCSIPFQNHMKTNKSFLLLFSILTLSPQSLQSFTSYRNRHHYSRTTTTTTTTSFRWKTTSSSLNLSSPSPNKNAAARAGESGYSILRQPVQWDTESDPQFTPPSDLDGSNDDSKSKLGWFEERVARASSSSSQKKQQTQKWKLKGVDDEELHHGKKRKEEVDQDVNLSKRTMETLDYGLVLRALGEECDTVAGKVIVEREVKCIVSDGGIVVSSGGKGEEEEEEREDDDDVMLRRLSARSVEGVRERYDAVREMQSLLRISQRKKKRSSSSSSSLGPPPSFGTTVLSYTDLAEIFEICDTKNQVLEGPELFEVTEVLQTLSNLHEWSLDLQKHNYTHISRLCSQISINEELLHILSNAFDENGLLSSKTFPNIGSLRSQIRTLKSSILSSIQSILNSPSIKTKLATEGGGPTSSEINGRIVIPIDIRHKNSVGIVHDLSRSGKTAYVEPTDIVSPTNELRQLEVELRQEEARVWRELTERIRTERVEIERSVAVAGQIDLIAARYRLGEKLAGVIPDVKDEGVMRLREARHPVLLLRELDDVIPNDVDLGYDANRGLVLTGPNSGGKTVILKLMGLVALMVRDGIPIPARPDGARVDYFDPVIADIGDLQSLDGDLSTFSGHLLVCREVLKLTQNNALVLMDELGSGTDPKQGVAIAQAVLEAILDAGARVAITTHYLELKQLAASDERFAVGGMQFVNGRPTYKLLKGTVGESFALAVAERLNLPRDVIERANQLLDQETRQMGDLIRDLEQQKSVLEQQSDDIKQKQSKLDEMERDMNKLKEKLAQEQLVARRKEAKRFAAKLEEKEAILEDILAKLKKDPSKKLLARSWDDIRFVRRDAITEAENVPGLMSRMAKQQTQVELELIPLAELNPRPEINVGDTLFICKKGNMYGKEATVMQLGGKALQVSVGSIPVRMKLTELALPPNDHTSTTNDQPPKQQQQQTPKLSKLARRAMAESETLPSSSSSTTPQPTKTANTTTLRTSSNTLDLRGCTFEEAKRKTQDFFSKAMMQRKSVVYLLHGHGTGVLKQKLREWLKRDREWVKKWKSADVEDGGDGLTMVELKKVQF